MLRDLLHAQTLIVPFVGEVFIERDGIGDCEPLSLEGDDDGQATLYAGHWRAYFTPRGWKPRSRAGIETAL